MMAERDYPHARITPCGCEYCGWHVVVFEDAHYSWPVGAFSTLTEAQATAAAEVGVSRRKTGGES